jgi:hypothetical protein
VVISANSMATSVIGRCRPVSTLASLIAVANGRVTDEIFTSMMRSRVAESVVAIRSSLSRRASETVLRRGRPGYAVSIVKGRPLA